MSFGRAARDYRLRLKTPIIKRTDGLPKYRPGSPQKAGAALQASERRETLRITGDSIQAVRSEISCRFNSTPVTEEMKMPRHTLTKPVEPSCLSS